MTEDLLEPLEEETRIGHDAKKGDKIGLLLRVTSIIPPSVGTEIRNEYIEAHQEKNTKVGLKRAITDDSNALSKESAENFEASNGIMDRGRKAKRLKVYCNTHRRSTNVIRKFCAAQQSNAPRNVNENEMLSSSRSHDQGDVFKSLKAFKTFDLRPEDLAKNETARGHFNVVAKSRPIEPSVRRENNLSIGTFRQVIKPIEFGEKSGPEPSTASAIDCLGKKKAVDWNPTMIEISGQEAVQNASIEKREGYDTPRRQTSPETDVPKTGRKIKTFQERFQDLLDYKAAHGHCNVSSGKSQNIKVRSLGKWCDHIRQAYRALERGEKPLVRLTKDDIACLEEIGFEWKPSKALSFDERFNDLVSFKSEYGHCNVPSTSSQKNKFHSLGLWCINIRKSYKAMNEGSPRCKYHLSKSQAERLEDLGFIWTNCCNKRLLTFDERLKDLLAFKAEFGHCNVPCTKSNNKFKSLGNWCSKMRQSYRATKEGGKLVYKLTQANIELLNEAGFKWNFADE